MSLIPGTNIPGSIAPFDTSDDYGTHNEAFGIGGWRSVDNIVDRDAITSSRRVVGMPVYVRSEDTTYQLVGGITNSNWQIYNTSQGSQGSLSSLTDVVITNLLPGQTLITDGVNWYNGIAGESITGSSANYSGTFSLNTITRLYTISHSTLPSITAGSPVISLQIPSIEDNLFAIGVLNRTLSSFDIVLSQAPEISGYYINWNLGLNGLKIVDNTVNSKSPTQEVTSRTLSNDDNNRVLHCTSSSTYTFIVPLDLVSGFSTMFSNDSGIINVSGSNGVYINDIRSIDNTAPNISVLIQDDDNRYKLVGGKA